MTTTAADIDLRASLALGLLQGPTELLPVSSSGHLVLAPWLLRSSYTELDPELRKSFEVALHAGTAAALLIVLHEEVSEAISDLDLRRIELMLLSFLPAAITALTFERLIERRSGDPRVVACGMIAGSLAMLLADRAPEVRDRADADWRDGLALGIAQSCALMPGVSRNGATLVAARLRGFRRADANALSRHSALPVIAGAVVLKGVRLARRRPQGIARPFTVGAVASFVSSLASARLIASFERRSALTPYAIYRLGLAAITLVVAAKRRSNDPIV